MAQGRGRDVREGAGRNDGDDGGAGAGGGPADEEEKRAVPLEIDDHFRLFGKEPWEVEYGEKCPECRSRIDEYGFCSCGSHGD